MINILQFAYGSNKGTAQAGEVFASPLGYQGTNTTYTASSVDGEELYEDANHEYYLAYTPVRPGTLRVLKTDGTVETNAVLADPYTGKVTGVSDGEVAYYIYDNESVPVQSPMIKMDIKSLPITAQSRKLSAIWSFDAKLIA